MAWYNPFVTSSSTTTSTMYYTGGSLGEWFIADKPAKPKHRIKPIEVNAYKNRYKPGPRHIDFSEGLI